MASAARSSNVNLYAFEDKADNDKKFEIEASNLDVKFEAAQDCKFKFASYGFYQGAAYYDLETRFGAIESDPASTDNAMAIAGLQADLATEQNSRVAGDLTRENATNAEIAARVAADSALQTALDTQEAKQESEKVATDASVVQEVSDRQAAVSAEAASRAADVAGLQSQISNILSNASPGVIDSISELLSAVNAEDASLLAQIAALQSDVAALQATVAALTNDE